MSDLNNQVRTFLHVADLGSFVRASERMFVTQAAVTTRIKALEEWLGYPCFVRSRHGAQLTPQGEHFLNYAHDAVTSLEEGRRAVRRLSTSRISYRFMSQFLLLETVALDWVYWMRTNAPEISISLDSSHSLAAAELIIKDELDFAIGYQAQAMTGVHFEKLFDEVLVLATSVTLDTNWRDHYIAIDWDPDLLAVQQHLFGEIEIPQSVTAPFVDTARMIMLRQPASAYVVERVARQQIDDGRLRLVDEAPRLKRPVHVIYPDKPRYPEVQNLALQGIRDATRELSDMGSSS